MFSLNKIKFMRHETKVIAFEMFAINDVCFQDALPQK